MNLYLSTTKDSNFTCPYYDVFYSLKSGYYKNWQHSFSLRSEIALGIRILSSFYGYAFMLSDFSSIFWTALIISLIAMSIPLNLISLIVNVMRTARLLFPDYRCMKLSTCIPARKHLILLSSLRCIFTNLVIYKLDFMCAFPLSHGFRKGLGLYK